MCREAGTGGVCVCVHVCLLKLVACTFANVTALPFTAWSAPGTELIMALFHSVLPVILEGSSPFYR